MDARLGDLIIRACLARDQSALARALADGADPHAIHASGASALGLCAMHGDKACFYALWRAGARDLGALDSPSRPAITISAELGNDASIRLLLACEADPNAKSLSGACALDWARRIDLKRSGDRDHRLSKNIVKNSCLAPEPAISRPRVNERSPAPICNPNSTKQHPNS